jgi:DHA1 family bicyclomycin/chloramphenicol resistance-like MFS transporter
LNSNAVVFLLALVIGAQPIATDMYLPAMPDLAKSLPEAVLWGVTFASTSTLTFFTLFYGLGQVMGGQWVDRYGRRRSLLVSLMVYVLCSLGCTFAPSLVWLLVLRAVQGFSVATIVVAARAALRDSFSAEEAPRAMSQIFIRMGVIVVLCPLIGGWLATHGGWRVTLATMTLYGALLLAWVAWRFPETASIQTEATLLPTRGWTLVTTLWKNRHFRLWTLAAAFTISGVFTFLTITSHIFIGLYGWSPSHYSWVLVGAACVFVTSNLICKRLLKTHTPIRIAMLGATLSLGGACIQLVGMGLLAANKVAIPLPVFLLLGHYTFQLGHGMLQSCAMTGAVADFPHMAGRAAAWSGLTMMVFAFAISQTAASFVNTEHTYGVWPWTLTILFCGVTLVLLTRRMQATMSA